MRSAGEDLGLRARGPEGSGDTWNAVATGLLDSLHRTEEGEEKALSDWMRFERPRLERMLGRRRGADGEDLLPELLLACVEQSRGAGDAAILQAGPWCAGTVRHIGARAVRGKVRDRALLASGVVASEALGFAPPAEAFIDEREEFEVRSRKTRTAIRRLPPPYAETLWLHHVEGVCERGVATFLHEWRGVGEEAAHAILRRGLEMLRASLREGVDPRRRWPGRYDRRNPWFLTPPRTTHFSMEGPSDRSTGIRGGAPRMSEPPGEGGEGVAMVIVFADNLTLVAFGAQAVTAHTDPAPLGANDRAGLQAMIHAIGKNTGSGTPTLSVTGQVSNDGGQNWIDVAAITDSYTSAGARLTVGAVNGAILRFKYIFNNVGASAGEVASVCFDLHVNLDHV